MALRIGLLPLYLKLYDDVSPALRQQVAGFCEVLTSGFGNLGLEVVSSGICRIEPEFSAAVDQFTRQDVDAVVSVHLAYSPSLEALQPLLSCRIPLILLDTTPDYAFGPHQAAEKISVNHGIHGVQDLCSMLVRNRRAFWIEAGHWQRSDVLQRVVDRVRAIAAARSLNGMKVGIIGEPFKGMGDFQVDAAVLERDVGVRTIGFSQPVLRPSSDAELTREAEYLASIGAIDDMPDEVLRANLAISRGLRSWIEDEQLAGFTCNFLHVTRDSVIDRMPFLFASVAMYEGLGYAGEGDVLTASLVAALLRLNRETSFTEMFCPDWEGGTVFLSHMGEINPRVCEPHASFRVKEYHYSDADQPVYTTGQFKAGQAHIVNLAALNDEQFRLIIAPVDVVHHPESSFSLSVHGWIRPEPPLARFLEQYSLLGGTHHSALVYGERTETLRTFGTTLGWDVQVISQQSI